MKSRFRALLVLTALASTVYAAEPAPAKPSLTIYAYDSWVAKGGLGPAVLPKFEKTCGCELHVLGSGDGAQILNRVQIDAERGKPHAQIVLGLDQVTFDRGKKYWDTSFSKRHVALDAHVTEPAGFYSYDYGFFSFIADRDALSAQHLSAPKSLTELLSPSWKKNVILEDPRTSTPGLAFVLYADAVQGAHGDEFWNQLRTQWLTLTPGWDAAYGLFLRKEAPLVWSYTTSQAYHEEHGDQPSKRRYEAVLFAEGQPMQIEGAAVVKGSVDSDAQKRLAQSFLTFLASPEVQAEVPHHQWMFPVLKGVKLPPSFAHVPAPRKVVVLKTSADEVQKSLSHWSKAVEGSF